MRKQFLAIIFIIFKNMIYAQIPSMPPTPEASAFAKYGEVPVKMFIGAPDINIPLYDIASEELAIPVTLNYLATGIRVEEVASWVGLNWSLSAGGAITRSIRGLKDEESQFGYFSQIDDIERIANMDKTDWTPTDMAALEDFAKGRRDSSPDLFFINLPGLSGQFVFDKNQVPHTIPYSNIKIEIGPLGPSGIERFVVTSENGTKYYLGQVDGRSAIDFTTSQMECGDGGQPYTANTSWHLLKITLANGRNILFHFGSAYNFSYINPNASEKIVYYSGPGSRHFENSSSCLSTYRITGYPIGKIESDDTEIVFDSSPNREDMSGALRMDKISIKSKITGKLIKDYLLDYSYYNPSGEEEDKRLKLERITQRGEDGISTPPYILDYDESISLPSRYSKAQDHWGYYNGKTSNDRFLAGLVPNVINGRTFEGGGDRSSDAVYLLAGILQKITYPTGGFTLFEYEPNMATKAPDEITSADCNLNPNCKVVSKSISTNCDPPSGPLCQDAELTFTMTSKVFDNASLGVTFSTAAMSNYDPRTPEYECNAFVYVLDDQGEGVMFSPAGGTAQQALTQCSQGTFQDHNITLKQGETYTMRATKGLDGVRSSMTLTYYEYDNAASNVPILEASGGLRVKQITHHDGLHSKNDQVKAYAYSPGILITEPQYFSFSQVGGFAPVSHESGSSNSHIALGSAQGSHICYQSVTEKIGLGGSNGETVYEFSYYADMNYQSLTNLPFVPRVSKDWLRGFNEAKTEFNTTYAKLTQYSSTQAIDEDRNQTKITWYVVGDGALVNNVSNPTSNMHRFDIGTLEFTSQWVYQDYISQKVFDPDDDSKFVETTTTYHYDNANHAQPSRQIVTDSHGNEIATKTLYPDDIISTSFLSGEVLTTPEYVAISKLKNTPTGQHRVATPIQVETYRNSKLIAKQRNLFKEENGLVLTSTIQSAAATNALEDRLIYHLYDTKGHPLEISNADDLHTAYIWGYNQSLPIAKIENASYAQVSSQVANLQRLSNTDDDTCSDSGSCDENILRTAMNELRNLPALSGAMITSYTYNPLQGITSITDPNHKIRYYQYDDFNRLKTILDFEGNILKKFEYNYADPTSPNNDQQLNYINVQTPLAGLRNEEMLIEAGPYVVSKSATFYDGLGRPIQQVLQQGSPAELDVIQAINYDAFGRQTLSYLPYVSNQSTGSKITDPINAGSNDYLTSSHHDFYNVSNDQIADDDRPYAETVFEASPLNRPIKQYGPGQSWKNTDAAIAYRYEVNQSNEVLLWLVDAEGNPVLNASGLDQYYASGALYKNVTVDEQQHEVIEFVDKQQRTILKRVQVHANDASTEQWADTYYVYDDLGNLRFVLPPEANADFEN
jgi:YD repeat-containing protein